MSHIMQLSLVSIIGIIGLLVLIVKVKLEPFISLLIVSIFIGLGSGMPFGATLKTVQTGMGNTLGFVAIVVGLGAMFGSILEISGGAEQIAQTLVKKFGEKRAPWALGLTGLIVAIPVFFDVGLIILIPLVYGLSQRTKKSLLSYGIPLLAGLAVAHAFIPPTPGPILVASILNADIGWVIGFGAIAAVPAMIIAGPIFGKYIGNKIYVETPEWVEKTNIDVDNLPSFGMVASIILVPLILILINTTSSMILTDGMLKDFLGFLGNPFVALILATLLAMYFLGCRRGYSREDLTKIMTKSLGPAGIIILITGAGGVLKQMLTDTGIGQMVGEIFSNSTLSGVVVAFIIAFLVRVSVGSATVSMVTAAGLMAPIVTKMGYSPQYTALIVISIASGSTVLSHVNDSGFWLVNKYMGLSVKDTFKAWTVMETIIGLVGFGVVLIISLFV